MSRHAACVDTARGTRGRRSGGRRRRGPIRSSRAGRPRRRCSACRRRPAGTAVAPRSRPAFRRSARSRSATSPATAWTTSSAIQATSGTTALVAFPAVHVTRYRLRDRPGRDEAGPGTSAMIAVVCAALPARADNRAAAQRTSTPGRRRTPPRTSRRPPPTSTGLRGRAAAGDRVLGSPAYRRDRVDGKPRYVKRCVDLYKSTSRRSRSADCSSAMPRTASARCCDELKRCRRPAPNGRAGRREDPARREDLRNRQSRECHHAARIGDATGDAMKGIVATIDGKPVEPFALIKVAPGERVIGVTAEGYTPIEKTPHAVEGGVGPRRRDLKARKPADHARDRGWHVDHDRWSRGRVTPSAPLELPAGTHLMTLMHRGREPVGRELVVNARPIARAPGEARQDVAPPGGA